jgi:hypothetical protein
MEEEAKEGFSIIRVPLPLNLLRATVDTVHNKRSSFLCPPKWNGGGSVGGLFVYENVLTESRTGNKAIVRIIVVSLSDNYYKTVTFSNRNPLSFTNGRKIVCAFQLKQVLQVE